MTHDDRMARLRAEERRALARARVLLGLDEALETADLIERAGSAVSAETEACRVRALRIRSTGRQGRARA